MNSCVFEEFLRTSYGQKTLESFNKMKIKIEDTSSFILKKFKGKIRPKNYLDVGGGNGVRTLEIIRGLGCLHTDFLEPSKEASKNFVKSAKELGLNFSVINSIFESFNPKKKYDFITSVHSWYYIDLSSVKKLYKILNKDGVACIFLDSKNDTIKKIQDICESQLHKFSSCNMEDITEVLDKYGINYEIHMDNRTLSGLLKKGQFTEKAKTIISLVAWTKWSKIPESIKNSIKELLLGVSKDDKYPSRRGLIVIRK